MTISKNTLVAVAGAGTMGSGIAQVLASAGYRVTVFEPVSEIAEVSKRRLETVLDRLCDKGRISPEERTAMLSRLAFVSDIADVPPSIGLFVEAIVEDLEAKRQLFATIESIVGADTILATNTSSLSVSAIAAACTNPERVIGLHFFNPAPLLDLVEVVPALQTSPAIVLRSRDFVQALGKIPVVAGDTPGFIVNRIARPFYGEALRILDEGLATIPEIDKSMRDVGGFRMGPFELMDLIGNDINYAVTVSVFESFFYDPRYRPSFTQKRMVDAGRLGRKTSLGYYSYRDGRIIDGLDPDGVAANTAVVERIVAMLINEAVDAVFWKVASPSDIETAMTKGVNYPKGLLAWGEELGFHDVLARIERLQHQYGEDRYRPSPLLRNLADGTEKINV